MAKGRKTGGKDWKAGESGNPNGSSGLPQDVRHARQLTQVHLERLLNQHIYSTSGELAATIAAPEAVALDKLVASIILTGIERADQARLEFVLCRLIGRVQERIEVSTPTPFVLKRRNGEEIIMGVSDGVETKEPEK